MFWPYSAIDKKLLLPNSYIIQPCCAISNLFLPWGRTYWFWYNIHLYWHDSTLCAIYNYTQGSHKKSISYGQADHKEGGRGWLSPAWLWAFVKNLGLESEPDRKIFLTSLFCTWLEVQPDRKIYIVF